MSPDHKTILELQNEVLQLKETISTDLKLLDEVLCMQKGSETWEELEKTNMAIYEAMARLRHAWRNKEMQFITMSLAIYFKKEMENEALHIAARKFADANNTTIKYALDLILQVIKDIGITVKKLNEINNELKQLNEENQ